MSTAPTTAEDLPVLEGEAREQFAEAAADGIARGLNQPSPTLKLLKVEPLLVDHNGKLVEASPDPACKVCRGSRAYRVIVGKTNRPCVCILRQLGALPETVRVARPGELLNMGGRQSVAKGIALMPYQQEFLDDAKRQGVTLEPGREWSKVLDPCPQPTKEERRAARLREAEQRLAAEVAALNKSLAPFDATLATHAVTERNLLDCLVAEERGQADADRDANAIRARIDELRERIVAEEERLAANRASVAESTRRAGMVRGDMTSLALEVREVKRNRDKVRSRGEQRLAPLQATVERLRRQAS